MVQNERGARYKVVVLDDNSVCRSLTKLVLERAGFEVLTISSSAGFEPIMDREKPDLALVDVGLPVVRGDVLIVKTRARLGTLCPIVLYSQRAQAELSRIAEVCGAAGYIQKSNDWVHLAESVSRFIKPPPMP